jgi:hypothetical protein
MKKYRHKKSAGCFPTSGNKLRSTGRRGRNAYKEWIYLAFRYKILHATPLRVEERGLKKDAGIPKAYKAGRRNFAPREKKENE